MKITDVKYGNFIKKIDDGTIWQVVGLDNTGNIKCHNGERGEQRQCAEYEGVRITPELLRLNGWTADKAYARIPIKTRSGFYVEYYFHEGTITLYSHKHGGAEGYCRSAPGLLYAHELQNFLELAVPEQDFIKIL